MDLIDIWSNLLFRNEYVLQGRDWSLFPWQLVPLPLGRGLVQVVTRICAPPPQVWLHPPQMPHSDHLLWTRSNNQELKIFTSATHYHYLFQIFIHFLSLSFASKGWNRESLPRQVRAPILGGDWSSCNRSSHPRLNHAPLAKIEEHFASSLLRIF